MKILRILGVLLLGVIALVLAITFIAYPPEYVFRVMAWQESDAFDWQKFPFHPLRAAQTAYHFDVAPDPQVQELFEKISGAEDWDGFLEENNTQAFIVIQDGDILHEKYFNNTRRDSIVTSFSVAKSVASALIGIHDSSRI